MTVIISSSLPVALVSGTGVTFNAPVVNLISTDDVYNVNNPSESLTDLLGAISAAQLVGSATIDGTIVGNHSIYTVPTGQKFVPTSVVFAVSDVVGSGVGPVINAGFTPSSYTDFIDSAVNSTYDLASGAFFAGGSGYAIGDVLSLVGGTHTTTAQLTITQAHLASIAVNAAGTAYAPADTITLAGGTHSTAAIVTVLTAKLVSATINSGGTGYAPTSTFNVTVAGGTASQAALVNVTTDGGGVIITINSVSTAGSYTVLPSLVGNVVTGGSGNGLTLNLTFGVNTVSITNVGSYTVTAATFTQASSSGSGTGATFNTALFGAHAATVSQAGSYSVLPSNHIATTGGAGTGATYDAVWAETAGDFLAIDTVGEIINFTDLTGTNYSYMTGGDVLTVRVAFPATFTTYSLKVFVFGFSFA